MKTCLSTLIFIALLLIYNTKTTLLKSTALSTTIQTQRNTTNNQSIILATSSSPNQSNYGLTSDDSIFAIYGPCTSNQCHSPNAYCATVNQCM